MKVIVDNKIPYIKETIENMADEVVYLPGKDFTPEAVKDADALIIRTRTHCNRELLEGSSVKFIATATIGFDHIDTEYCREAGIEWTNAPGCNAGSVGQYLHSVLLLLQQEKGLNLKNACIGIVGAGNVGKKVAEIARSLGMKVLLNDPPRADKEGTKGFVDLATIARECDVITFHVPLNREGIYKTFHFANREFFLSLKKAPFIINTSRGEVIETEAIREALQNGEIRDAVIDVWENEPNIDLDLLNRVFIGTPHIAGYSADGKANATRMSLEALCHFYKITEKFTITPPQPADSVIRANNKTEAFLQMYDPRSDCQALRLHPENFEQLRGDYPLRREKEAYSLFLLL